ncbi:MAG: autotransporter outer membrane beta-barrel domain-containing protein [Parachlamydiales bacterium]
MAKNHHHGKDLDLHFDGGLIFNRCNAFSILPFVSLDYFYMRENGFTETNADSLNLHVKKSNYHLLRSEIGSHFNKCFLCRKDLIADLKLSYVQETRFDGRHYSSNLVDQSGNFVVSGIKYNRNIFSPSLAISKLFINDNISASIRYDGEFAKKYINHNLSAQIVKSF